jgi:hypothetical protein
MARHNTRRSSREPKKRDLLPRIRDKVIEILQSLKKTALGLSFKKLCERVREIIRGAGDASIKKALDDLCAELKIKREDERYRICQPQGAFVMIIA